MRASRALSPAMIDRLIEDPWIADYFEDAMDGGDRYQRRLRQRWLDERSALLGCQAQQPWWCCCDAVS